MKTNFIQTDISQFLKMEAHMQSWTLKSWNMKVRKHGMEKEEEKEAQFYTSATDIGDCLVDAVTTATWKYSV